MLYYCCFAHPSLMMRRRFFDTLTYASGKIEDYKQWVSHLSNDKIKYANLGITLLKLRKHDQNVSGTNTSKEEIPLK
jgi:hypothetical protein